MINKLRLSISGKSMTEKIPVALWIASQLQTRENGSLVVDTMRGKSAFYATEDIGVPFKMIQFDSPFDVNLLIDDVLIPQAKEFEVIIIERPDHFFNGPGGILDIGQEEPEHAEKIQEALIQAIANLPCHVICVTSRKDENLGPSLPLIDNFDFQLVFKDYETVMFQKSPIVDLQNVTIEDVKSNKQQFNHIGNCLRNHLCEISESRVTEERSA